VHREKAALLYVCVFILFHAVARLLARVALARAAVEVDGGLPGAAGGGAALGVVSDGAAAGGALLRSEGVEDAAGARLDLGAVEDGVREVLGLGDEVAGRGQRLGYAPSAHGVAVARSFVLFLAGGGDEAVVQGVSESAGAQGEKADGTKGQHACWRFVRGSF
jgi:hypothetical protein